MTPNAAPPGRRPPWRGFAATVLLSMAGVGTFAWVQHRLILGVTLRPGHFAVPLLVGATFGTLLALVRRSRARERAAAAAVAARDAQIQAMNEVLEERVRARTAELEQKTEALLRSQRLEVLGRVAGGVAHDFNNILMAMIGCAAALRDEAGTLAPGRAAHVNGILDELDGCSERARTLVARLLTLGRGRSGKVEVLALDEVARQAAPMLRRLAGEAVDLRLLLEPGPALVRADRSQLEQLLLNLVVNARDAMARGGILELAVERADDGVRLRVADSGCGMDDETRARMFEPFFTTKEAGRGTGLGLVVVAEVARRADARVEVASRPGLGTTFTVLFPHARAEAPPEDAGPRAVPGRRLALLLVDDDGGVRRGLATALEGAGHDVLQAADAPGAEAVLAGRAGPLDAIVCDVFLPGASGPELVRRLAARGIVAPVLYISGYPRDQVDGHAAGAVGVLLAKPFTADELLERLADLTAPVGLTA